MKVRLMMPTDSSHGNLLWAGKYPMRGGKFPPDHPCYEDPKPFVMGAMRVTRKGEPTENVPGEQPESDSPLGKFRARGYWASCFPEGDGITFSTLNGQDAATVAKDVADCFGWEVYR